MLLLFLLLAPPALGAGAPASRALDGMEKQRDPEPGCRARCVGCAQLLGGRGAVRLTPHLHRVRFHPAGVRASSHTQAPLSGEGLHPSPLGTPLCRTSRILAFPCASLAPPPALSAGYVYPLLVPRCFWGDSGEASSNPLSSRCAPRSGPLLAGSSCKDSAQGSSRSAVRPLLLSKPGVWKLGYRRLDCAARRSPGEPGPGRVPSTRAPVLRRPVRSQDPFGPTRAFSLCRQISPCFVETQLPTSTQGLIPGIPSLKKKRRGK